MVDLGGLGKNSCQAFGHGFLSRRMQKMFTHHQLRTQHEFSLIPIVIFPLYLRNQVPSSESVLNVQNWEMQVLVTVEETIIRVLLIFCHEQVFESFPWNEEIFAGLKYPMTNHGWLGFHPSKEAIVLEQDLTQPRLFWERRWRVTLYSIKYISNFPVGGRFGDFNLPCSSKLGRLM